MSLRAPEILLCDADGNLFPSEEPAFVASADVTNDYLAALGVTERLDAETLRRTTTGKNFRTTAVDLADRYGVAPVDLELWVRREREAVTEYLGNVLVPDPEVVEPLRRLSERMPLAAVSSSASARLAACFAATGLAPLFPEHVRYSAEDSLPVPTSKPHPAVYLFACEREGFSPSQALAVEDSVPGAQSAVAAGIATVGNLMFVHPEERVEREHLLREVGVSEVVTSWQQLEQLISGAPLVGA